MMFVSRLQDLLRMLAGAMARASADRPQMPGVTPCRALRQHAWLSTLALVAAALAAIPPTDLWAQTQNDAKVPLGGDRFEPAATGRMVITNTGPRTSPFNPPTKDVFLTDASPGLDTGCIFNSNPLNPLTVAIAIDRFVGDVDANGFLINPAPLISAGIIPASVDIILPAFDVDFNGPPPPERDEVLFNGQSLGFLTGDNNIWKLNTFRVDIRRVKFPARPAAGANPVPVNNRLQVRIDTLGVNRWCTQVDWVAIALPIRPKLALDLEVTAGNRVRSDDGARAITKIQEQTFDANCNVSTTVGPIDQFPFSGPALTAAGGSGSAKLRASIKACPEGSLKPGEVKAEWAISGTQRRGSLKWMGLQGEVEYLMPGNVGAHDATLKLTLDNGQTLDATRRLYVTRKAPLVAVSDPCVYWYRLGTQWASGESAEDSIVTKVRSGLYGYGNASWRYGYEFGPAVKCDWLQLAANPLACNYSDCYVFSDVLENISATLGVGGLAPVTVFATRANESFLTSASPSLDPAFPGSARPFAPGSAFDRYVFSSHSLRQRSGVFHDATFDKGYANSRAFIVANTTGAVRADVNGNYLETFEGPRIYAGVGPGYDSWGTYRYVLNPPRPALVAQAPSAQPSAIQLVRGAQVQTSSQTKGLNVAANTPPELVFSGVTAWRTPDIDGNGRFERLEAEVTVDVPAPGPYTVIARLEGPGGAVVANRPAWESMLLTRADFNAGSAGRRTILLRFSGEQIRRSQLDGPYTLALFANGELGPAGGASFATPAYRWVQFGEVKAVLTSLAATPLDTDTSGRFDTLRLTFETDVALPGPYQVAVNLSAGGTDLLGQARLVSLLSGLQTVTVDLPTTGIARAGLDAPYTLTLNLADSLGANVDSLQQPLLGLLASQFETVVDVSANLVEQRVDSNGNGLIDLLRVGADVRSRNPLNTLVRATLVAVNGATVGVDKLASLPAGAAQRVDFDFSGPLIRSQQMDSAYALELSFRNPNNLQEFDAVRLPLRGSYIHTTFDPEQPAAALALNGQRSDRGVDTNSNTLFDRLQVDLGVDLLQADTYEWSARLVDRNGQELGFATGRGALAAGSRSIRLEFDGRAIGVNGLDGPYFVRSLLMAGNGGANLVATLAGETSGWRANQFEGFVVRAPADINGDGRVDNDDVLAFNRALGSSVGEPSYNRFADFDRDGRITLNDLRIFRSLLRSPTR